MIKFLICLLFCCFASSAVLANCYNQKEAEAEQGIKIHSELMVIGLNCQHMTPAGWKNFYSQYRDFSNKYADVFSGYEKIMLTYLSRQGSGAERKLHAMRTGFANQVSTDVARMRPDVFCSQYASRIPQVASMSRGALQNWVADSSRTQRLSQPLCY